MSKDRFDLRAFITLDCTINDEKKPLSVMLENIVRYAPDSVGLFYEDFCDQVEKQLPTLLAAAFIAEAEKQSNDCYDEWIYIEPACIEQCTGLNDKHGHPIYEGDIVDILCEVDELGVIEWMQEEAKFAVHAPFAGFIADFDNYRGINLEVIGNIHQNSALLAVKK